MLSVWVISTHTDPLYMRVIDPPPQMALSLYDKVPDVTTFVIRRIPNGGSDE